MDPDDKSQKLKKKESNAQQYENINNRKLINKT